MRLRSALLVVACTSALSACIFQLEGITVPLASDDLAVGDLEVVDSGAELGPPDLAEDLGSVVDFANVDFTTPPLDLAGADLLSSVPGFPSHVAYHYLIDSAADWTVAQNTTIDTTTLSISSPTPAGTIVAIDGGYTILALRKLSVGTAAAPDVRLTVVGTRPLIIVAGTEIHVYGLIDAGAHTDVPGPFGGRPATGTGVGISATTMPRAAGGGAGYGTNGGTGGGSPATLAGTSYGDAALAMFVGGSGGGAGRGVSGTSMSACISPAHGGAGGGTLQLSSRSIIIESSANGARGTVSVSGGGGSAGCGSSAGGMGGGGGGGGSGGSLLIEAPNLQLGGRIVAAGGGGAGGGAVALFGDGSAALDGYDGYDGFLAALPPLSSFGGFGLSSGGVGYNGITTSPAGAKNGAWTDNVSWGGGGGGGGAGRIRIRASSAQNPMNTTPPPSVTVDLPPTIP